MSVEPHNAVTVHFRPMARMDQRQTVADYRAKLAERFGSLPDYKELAKLERQASEKRNRVYASVPAKVSAGNLDRPHPNTVLATWNDQTIFAAIPDDGGTTGQIAAIAGSGPEGTRVSLIRLRKAGKVRSIELDKRGKMKWFKVKNLDATPLPKP